MCGCTILPRYLQDRTTEGGEKVGPQGAAAKRPMKLSLSRSLRSTGCSHSELTRGTIASPHQCRLCSVDEDGRLHLAPRAVRSPSLRNNYHVGPAFRLWPVVMCHGKCFNCPRRQAKGQKRVAPVFDSVFEKHCLVQFSRRHIVGMRYVTQKFRQSRQARCGFSSNRRERATLRVSICSQTAGLISRLRKQSRVQYLVDSGVRREERGVGKQW